MVTCLNMSSSDSLNEKVSITPLLKRMWHESPATKPTATEIACALGLIFTNSLSEVQMGALLTCLHFTELDIQSEILYKCASAMRNFATCIDVEGLGVILEKRGRKEGGYRGGLVRIRCLSFHNCFLRQVHFPFKISLFMPRDIYSSVHHFPAEPR
jgi:anthranilate phosphoribosyltransferase